MFRNEEADVVYKLKDRNLFILIEHQTKIDYSMPYRILKYEIEIIKSAIDKKKLKNKSYKMPTVIAVVLYTGKKKWNASKYLEEKQEKLEGVESRIASYNVIDVNNYTEKELLEDETFITKMMLVEKAKNTNETVKYLNKIVSSIKEKNKVAIMTRYITMVFKDKIGEEKVDELIRKIMGGGEEMLASVETVTREWNAKLRQGREEGRKEGETYKQLVIVKNMLKEKLPISVICRVSELDEKEVRKIQNEK